MRGLKIFVSAGEPSGDLHGSRLVAEILQRNPTARVNAMGGARLRSAGANIVVNYQDLALIGVVQVLPKARAIYRAWKRIRRHLEVHRPDLVILIDFPDFNFLLGRAARALGLKVFYYISPQVWAWRSGRVRSLKRFVDAMAVILPFEEAFYRQRGMAVHFVGHPLVDEVRVVEDQAACRRRLGLGSDPVVCLLPGSRTGEVRTFLPLLADAAGLLHKSCPSAQMLVPVAPGLDPPWIAAMIRGVSAPLRLVHEDTYRAIRAADVAVAVSGTVTLESALLGTPLVVVYKVSSLEYHLGRHLIRVQSIGLPNVILGRRVCPELIQQEARPERIAQEALHLIRDPERADEQRRWFERLTRMLGEPGAAARAAALALDLC